MICICFHPFIDVSSLFLVVLFQLPHEMQAKLSQYIRVDTNSHSDSEGSTSGIGTATDNAYHILPASDSPVSSCPFSSSTTTSLVYGNGK